VEEEEWLSWAHARKGEVVEEEWLSWAYARKVDVEEEDWSWAHARKVEMEEEERWSWARARKVLVWACKTRVKDRRERDVYGRGPVARRHLQAPGPPT